VGLGLFVGDVGSAVGELVGDVGKEDGINDGSADGGLVTVGCCDGVPVGAVG
jgi:hypothetical protein